MKRKDYIPVHSHNDYLQETPLFKALSKTFKSIEADVYKVGDSLFVAHDFDKIQQGYTLQNLYLEPLQQIVQKRKLEEELFLLVDIKKEGEKAYPQLEKILEEYKEMLTRFERGKVVKGNVCVIISGDRPINLMKETTKRYSFLDGRILQLEEEYSEKLIPLYSDDWANYFKWDGYGEMSQEEQKKLAAFAQKAKKRKAWLRFWNTPSETHTQRQNVMKILSEYENILIGTDHIDEAALFFVKKNKKKMLVGDL